MTRNTGLAAIALLFTVAAAIYFVSLPGGRVSNQPTVMNASGVIEPPFVMFRTLGPTAVHGRVSMVRLDAPGSTRYVSELSCARLHFAGGRGLCLTEEPVGTSVVHAAYIFDRAFTRGPRIELTGIPTRVRVSPDGRRAAITVYGEEHSPDGEERLATNTIVVDLAAGSVVANLREFAIDRAGFPPLEGPLDFASVTFDRDADRFYATLSTASDRFLVTGSVTDRRLTLVAPGLASEAVSPDGKRIVVKKRVGDRGYWQVLVFDLTTKSEAALNQGLRSIDDQVEWLDAGHVVYHDATDRGTDVWALSTDGVTPPQLLIVDAYSPAVQH